MHGPGLAQYFLLSSALQTKAMRCGVLLYGAMTCYGMASANYEIPLY
jgi:hypothetical protein